MLYPHRHGIAAVKINGGISLCDAHFAAHKKSLLDNCPKYYFQRYGGFGWGGGVTTYTIGFYKWTLVDHLEDPTEDFLELRDVILNSGCRRSVKRLGGQC